MPAVHSRFAAFTILDWALLLGVGTMWGSSYILMKIAVAEFDPASVAWLRLALGAGVLALVPAARRPLKHRRDWWLIIALGFTWMAVPFVLIPIAQQTIDSSLAGMINGAAALFTALFAALWFRNRPSLAVTLGLLIGFLGVVSVTVPYFGGEASTLGIVLMLLAVVMFGIAYNLSEPLGNRNGALAVIWRAMLVSCIATTPLGAFGLTRSAPTLDGWVAVVLLGAVSTGMAFACFTVLIRRVGASRASVSVYLIPGVAILLGALLGGEQVHPFALVGIVLILLGAYLTSRRTRSGSASKQGLQPAADPGGRSDLVLGLGNERDPMASLAERDESVPG